MGSLLAVFQIERKELPRVLWMGTASALLGCTVATARVGLNHAFLDHYSVAELPYAYGLSGVLGLLTLWGFERSGGRTKFSRRMQLLVFFCALQTGLAALACTAAGLWAGWALIAYSCFSPLVTLSGLVFWSMAREMFTLREQRRLIAVLAGGEVIAAISCYIAIGVLSERGITQAPHFVFASALALVGLGLVFRGASTRFPLEADKQSKRAKASRVVGASTYKEPYFLQMAGISLLSIVCLFVLDFAFMDQLTQIEDSGGMGVGAMLALIFGVSKGTELFAKVFLSARALELMGLRLMLMFLPLMLVLMSTLTFITGYDHTPEFGGFTTLAYVLLLAKWMWEVLRRAFFGPQFNLLYQAVPAEQRQTYQTRIDGTFRQVAVVIAAVVLAPLRDEGTNGPLVFVVLAVLAASWVVLTRFACTTYKDRLIEGLKSSADRIRRFKSVRRADEDDLSDLVSWSTRLPTSFSPRAPRWVREIALQRVRDAGDLALRGPLATLAASKSEDALVGQLASKLKAEYDHVETLARNIDDVAKMTKSAHSHERILGAHALRYQDASSRPNLQIASHRVLASQDELLENLLWDSDSAVFRAAIRSAASFNAHRFSQRICSALADPHLADVAVQALTRLGPTVDVALGRIFSRPGQSEEIQLRIMSIYGARKDGEAQKWIQNQLNHPRTRVRESAMAILAEMNILRVHGDAGARLKAQAKLEADIKDLAFDVGWLVAALCGLPKEESSSVDNTESKDVEALRRALLDDLRRKRAALFNCLVVLYPSRKEAINCARLNLDSDMRAGTVNHVDHALEVLRQVVKKPLHEFVLPLAQGPKDMLSMNKLRSHIVERASTPDEWAREIVVCEIRRAGLWAKACALKFLSGRDKRISEAMMHHPSPLLREQAGRALAERDRGGYNRCSARMGRAGEALDRMLFEAPYREELKREEETLFGLVQSLDESVLGPILSCEERLRLVQSAEQVSLPANSSLGLRDTDVCIVLSGRLINRPRTGSKDDLGCIINENDLTTFGLGTRALCSGDEPARLLKTSGYRVCELVWGRQLLSRVS
ncbi:MAG: hypothetical protein AAGF11_12600 [Myxococcota bacterium]